MVELQCDMDAHAYARAQIEQGPEELSWRSSIPGRLLLFCLDVESELFEDAIWSNELCENPNASIHIE